MKKNVYNYQRNNKMKKRLPFVILFLFMMNIVSMNDVHAQSYKQDTAYLLQKVEPIKYYFYLPFKYGLVMPTFYGYYVVDDETLQDFFKQDSVIYEQTIMLCDPTNEMFTDSAIVKEVKRFTRIMDFLLLDDSEIYRIGKDMYIIRKIRYAYYDNNQIKVYIRGAAIYWWDDLQEEDLEEYNKIHEVGQLYERDYYQIFHHLIELLPTPPQISKYRWKRLYQLGEEKTKNN